MWELMPSKILLAKISLTSEEKHLVRFELPLTDVRTWPEANLICPSLFGKQPNYRIFFCSRGKRPQQKIAMATVLPDR
jgi:hypothetical protein